MSWQAVTWVLENSEATLGSRLVILAIASHANREGRNAFPSLDTLAREVLLSRREVIYAVQALEERGELTVHRGIGRGNPNRYELPQVERWLEKVKGLHQLKGAADQLKGAKRNNKRCNQPASNPAESTTSPLQPLEPSKALTVKAVSRSLAFPEPSKPPSQHKLLAERDRQLAAMREKGYLQ